MIEYVLIAAYSIGLFTGLLWSFTRLIVRGWRRWSDLEDIGYWIFDTFKLTQRRINLVGVRYNDEFSSRRTQVSLPYLPFAFAP
jgi:hypothetical protein